MWKLLSSRCLLAGVSLAAGTGLGLTLGIHRDPVDRLSGFPAVAAESGPPALYPPAPATEIVKFGFPTVPQLRSRESYVLAYDPRTRNAAWVLEQLDAGRLQLKGSERGRCEFREDPSVHEYHRARNSDFKGSGFDRGHLAAAANHRHSQKCMDDTFYLSNVVPQV
ncbi:hypothetical protein chiPu_0028103 [Chiloscyllium punctatum]|uniref:Endonuclease n=1 Tax=Chiloscyllium punctatum TaxID=137246 RepID=A0A401TNH7_CHIPU|nr:hypothetical protein [Chiloscyllium punctatum]